MRGSLHALSALNVTAAHLLQLRFGIREEYTSTSVHKHLLVVGPILCLHI